MDLEKEFGQLAQEAKSTDRYRCNFHTTINNKIVESRIRGGGGSLIGGHELTHARGRWCHQRSQPTETFDSDVLVKSRGKRDRVMSGGGLAETVSAARWESRSTPYRQPTETRRCEGGAATTLIRSRAAIDVLPRPHCLRWQLHHMHCNGRKEGRDLHCKHL